MTVFEAYITNLGKYAEGQLVGETLKFPATTEEVQSLLKKIGVDGVRYEEFFITAFDGDVMGLYDYLTEYENLDELNHLAHLISELGSDEIETLEAVLNKGDHTSSVADIINLVHNLDCYDLHPGVTDDETLGRICRYRRHIRQRKIHAAEYDRRSGRSHFRQSHCGWQRLVYAERRAAYHFPQAQNRLYLSELQPCPRSQCLREHRLTCGTGRRSGRQKIYAGSCSYAGFGR